MSDGEITMTRDEASALLAAALATLKTEAYSGRGDTSRFRDLLRGSHKLMKLRGIGVETMAASVEGHETGASNWPRCCGRHSREPCYWCRPPSRRGSSMTDPQPHVYHLTEEEIRVELARLERERAQLEQWRQELEAERERYRREAGEP